MTTFCVKSVDHCKKLVSENEGKLNRVSCFFSYRYSNVFRITRSKR